MSRQTLLFALLFLVALAAWQLGDIELAPEPTTKVENYQPDFTAKNLVTTRFNAEGLRTERLESRYAEYYQILEQATFDKPVSTCSTSRAKPSGRSTPRPECSTLMTT